MNQQMMEHIAIQAAVSYRSADSTSLLEAVMHTTSTNMGHNAVPMDRRVTELVPVNNGEHKSYSSVRSTLTTRICDAEYNNTYLMDKPWTPCGPFAVVYRVRLGGEAESTPVTNDLMRAWGVSKQQLHTDALEAERKPVSGDPSRMTARPRFGLYDRSDKPPAR